jgi:NAD(P)-dependent dehydrogenase (short-subunit alcohol dehydrogenase family)
LASEGAAVVVFDREETRVKTIVDEITWASGRAIGHVGDASLERDVEAMVAATSEAFGRLDGLVNTVATVRDSDRILDKMDVEGWDHIMAVNVRGPMLACKHAMPIMLANGGGSIINFTSPLGFQGDITRMAYSTSKAAIMGLTRSVATVYGKQGVRCNAIAPHDIWDAPTKAKLGAEFIDLAERSLLTPRSGRPEDIAHMAAFLLSDKSEFITGQILFVDGGVSAHMPWVGMK